jgi:hypothetical protein
VTILGGGEGTDTHVDYGSMEIVQCLPVPYYLPAELTAIHLATKILRNHVEYRTCRIYIDSQAAIRAIDYPRRQSGQSIIRDILDSIDEITNEHPYLRFEIVWIPGHAEIEGNELVDAEAKKAALDPTLSQIYNYKPLKSALIRYIKTAAKKQWQTIWNTNTKTAIALQRIMKGRQAKTGPALYNEIAGRRGAAIIAQLRTGDCGLNRYLHRFSLRNSSYCRYGYGKETVEHYLLECREYRDQRGKLRREVWREKMWMEVLLGDPKIIKHTLEDIKETNRLDMKWGKNYG